MARGKAEDAGGLTPAKDDNAAPYHFAPRTLPTFMCVDYTPSTRGKVKRFQKISQKILPSTGWYARPEGDILWKRR